MPIATQHSRTERADEIVDCARSLIEKGDGDRLTMRRLADELGIQAPSLYKHFPDKEAITTALHVDYLAAQRDALVAAFADGNPDRHPLARVGDAYRAHATTNVELYRFLFLLPYPRAQASGILRVIRRQWYLAAGDHDLALAAYAFVRGMVDMELHARYPAQTVPDAAFDLGLAALIDRID